ncbi:MAG TPA: energy transducer TonB [Candidatus Dormibacteraeota bacterium]|nr:energy transducer TonB [Candidatus Dormibacteraeota bacterium]
MARDTKSPNSLSAAVSDPISASQPVAKEVSVLASGARPASASGERELFTEATTTVLVSKNGAVIRLAAAVVPGQLLFLVNQESRREVVTQVLRKRYFRPTNCYVELQFTESAPDFWGMEFGDSASSQTNSQQAEVVKRVQSAEPTSDNPARTKPLPSPREVEKLKQEVNVLRDQLNSLSQAGVAKMPASNSDSTAASPVAEALKNVPSAPVASSPQKEVTNRSNASRLPIEPEILPIIVASKTETEPYGTVRKARPPRPPNLQVASNSFARIIPLAAGFLLLAAGVAWYARLLPGLSEPNSSSAALLSSSARDANPGTPALAGGRVAPGPVDSPLEAGASRTPSVASSQNSSASTLSAAAVKSPQVPPVERAAPPTASAPAKKNVSVVNVAKHSPRSSLEKTSSTLALSNGQGVVPPKLLSSVQGIAPPEAVRGFVTGNVVVDAVVGPTGRVISSTVVSGRPSLRASALETIKQYRYQPATQNGRSVAAHVTITVQCWFEP